MTSVPSVVKKKPTSNPANHTTPPPAAFFVHFLTSFPEDLLQPHAIIQTPVISFHNVTRIHIMHFILLMLALACSVTVATAQTTLDTKAVGVRPAGYNTLQPLANAAPTGNAGLFVGVNEFTKDRGIAPLNFAVHDAIELAHLFVVELKLIPPENCVLLISGKPAENAKIIQQHLQQLENHGVRVGPAERAEILTTFIDLTAIATVNSQLLVCAFSSHGFNEEKVAYVMPTDGSRKLLRATAVPVDDLETSMTASKAGHRLFFVDACQERVSAKGNNPVGNGASKLLIDALLKPTGQAKLVSCSPNQFSFENGSLGGVGHGVFTWHLLEALRGSAQPDAQNFIRLGAVSRYVSDGVQKWAQDNNRPLQTPLLQSPEATRDLPLALRSSDLQTVIAQIGARKTDDTFTAQFRDRLIQGLNKINPAVDSDQELLQQTQQFLRGDLKSLVFCRYATSELDRILGVMAAAAPVKPATADAPMKPAPAASPAKPNSNPLTNSIGMVLLPIPAGTFTMGSPASEKDRDDDETQHQVTLSRPFYMGRTEVTQGQWKKVMGTEPWKGEDYVQEGDDYPAVYISWDDAVAFCKKLSDMEGRTYRLPTEAEWEYACRGGTKTAFSFGNDKRDLGKYAWFIENTYAVNEGYAHPVAQKLPNPFGLHDMHGNVWEWCSDWYDDYPSTPLRDPQGPDSGSFRVLRGGSWYRGPSRVRCARRDVNSPEYGSGNGGFRLVLE